MGHNVLGYLLVGEDEVPVDVDDAVFAEAAPEVFLVFYAQAVWFHAQLGGVFSDEDVAVAVELFFHPGFDGGGDEPTRRGDLRRGDPLQADLPDRGDGDGRNADDGH